MTDIKRFLKEYDGEELRLMEVCGTHTAQIARCGIASMLSPKIRLISGPGCPVCVTVLSYIDRLVDLSKRPGTVVATFGDMIRVPGSSQSLYGAMGEGGQVRMVYSPLEVLDMAAKDPGRIYVFAAVGFETTAPAYGLLAEQAIGRGIGNVRLLTSLKTMPPVIGWICKNQGGVDGFLAPGHVSVVTGSQAFEGLAKEYGLPFVVAGFEGEQLLAAIYALVRLRGQGKVLNLYPSVVTREGNLQAREQVLRYFEPCPGAWRGLGVIPGSGMALRQEFAWLDEGSRELLEDLGGDSSCHCPAILTGRESPPDCPSFGKDCRPESPKGACMVSAEGSCYHYMVNFGGNIGGADPKLEDGGKGR